MPIYRTIDDSHLTLSKRIIDRYPSGFVGAIIEGERGYGKSSYALKVMAEVYYRIFKITETEAWEESLNHMLFSMDDAINFVNKNIETGDVSPVWCLDDATVHFCSYKFFTNLYEVILIHGMFDTIRTVCTGLLLTCPKRDMLLSALRNYDDYKIEIIMDYEWQRIARGYKQKTTPIGQKRTYKNFEDNYSCYLPNWVYDKYMIKRNFYLKQVNTELQDILKNKDKRLKIKDVKQKLMEVGLKKQIEKMQRNMVSNESGGEVEDNTEETR
jgi:hypothetical protein